MHNICTIYRFNTPFLELEQQKDKIEYLIKKIEKSIEFEGIKFKKLSNKDGNYFVISLILDNNLGKLDFYYISEIQKNIYYLPIFKLNIFFNNNFLLNNSNKKNTVKFLNNIFECFDGLNEKEFLIDINNGVFYESGFFKTKKSPLYDFSDINKIQKKFETKNGIKILENFINKYSNSNFELTYQKSKYYHKIHSIFLYFIYIVFLMYQNIKKTNITLKELKDIDCDGIFEGHISLIQKRLHYIEQIHNDTFQKYRNRLELFFKLF